MKRKIRTQVGDYTLIVKSGENVIFEVKFGFHDSLLKRDYQSAVLRGTNDIHCITEQIAPVIIQEIWDAHCKVN